MRCQFLEASGSCRSSVEQRPAKAKWITCGQAPVCVAWSALWVLYSGLSYLDWARRASGGCLQAPVVVADKGYGVSLPLRLALEERGPAYAPALTGKEVAHPEETEPHRPAYGALGPPTLPRYRTPLRALSQHAAQITTDTLAEVTWRQGSKGRMTSRFAVLTAPPAGKQALAAALEAGGGNYLWDGVLPAYTVLVERPAGQEAPTGNWISNLPATKPVADLVRWAKMRWRIEHDYRELKHGLDLGHFGSRNWRGRHDHITLSPPPRPPSPCGGSIPKPPMPA
ncbi:transposase [Streptomyces sp. NPDC052109]|uniref:transposase n=1 Tax=Streptomyces sp. NPDC052109 TaxID=3155527 RepID=UPI00343E4F54